MTELEWVREQRRSDRYEAALRAIIAQYDAFDRSGTHQQSGLAGAARIAREALAQGPPKSGDTPA